MQSVFFLHLPGNLDLLKAQLSEYPGDIRPSFQTKGFATFIIDERAKQAIKRSPPFLCLAFGFDAKRVEHAPSVWVERDELVFSGDEELYFADPKGNIWHGRAAGFSTVAKLSQLQQPQEAPSRSWLKIAQAFAMFPRSRQGHALEIGCAPGGAAYFLLQQGLKLTGIDPGEMHPSFTLNDNFQHLKKPVQDILPRDLTQYFDLIAVDTNLPAGASMRESLRLASWSKSHLRELFLTIKLPSPRLVRGLGKYQKELKRMGFNSQFVQLPSHHREILLYTFNF